MRTGTVRLTVLEREINNLLVPEPTAGLHLPVNVFHETDIQVVVFYTLAPAVARWRIRPLPTFQIGTKVE